MPADQVRPIVAFAMGDAAGVGSELMARMLLDPEVMGAARFIVLGDIRVLERGATAAGVPVSVPVIAADAPIPDAESGAVFVNLGHLDPAAAPFGKVGVASGRFALENFRTALLLGKAGRADAVAFTPFNKAAMRLAHPSYDDEIGYTAEVLGFDGVAKEFNILEGLWNARVTSHVPLKDVAALLTRKEIVDNLGLTADALRASGIAKPAHRGGGAEPACGRRRQFRPRGDRRDRPGGGGGEGAGHRLRWPVPGRHGVPARPAGRFRRRADHVSRPGGAVRILSCFPMTLAIRRSRAGHTY
ncbi:MAG: 4-hydroxythreonine-4-phosphate dehydrogenase PdxA, partial [Nitrospira sp.]